MLDGRVVGEPLDGAESVIEWRLPRAPAEPRIVLVQLMTPDGMLSNALPLPVVPPVAEPEEPTDVVVDRNGRLAELAWSHATGVTGSATRYDVFRGRLGDLRREGFGGGECLTPVGWTEAGLRDGERPASGEAFYYVVRAQNQAGATGWGSTGRDDQIARSELRCEPLFP